MTIPRHILATVISFFCLAPPVGLVSTNAIASDGTAALVKEQASVPSTLQSPVAGTEKASGAAHEKSTAPVTGAFGIPLGKRFDPCMVAEVISQEDHNYRGQDKAEYRGTLYRIEPRIPNRYFDRYAVKTTKDGVIYAIQGEYEHREKKNLCEQTRHLAGLLEGKYGKPRGKGMLGEWYSFRDAANDTYRGVRFYAPRCRNGRYSINYNDDPAKQAALPPPPEPSEMSGL